MKLSKRARTLGQYYEFVLVNKQGQALDEVRTSFDQLRLPFCFSLWSSAVRWAKRSGALIYSDREARVFDVSKGHAAVPVEVE